MFYRSFLSNIIISNIFLDYPKLSGKVFSFPLIPNIQCGHFNKLNCNKFLRFHLLFKFSYKNICDIGFLNCDSWFIYDYFVFLEPLFNVVNQVSVVLKQKSRSVLDGKLCKTNAKILTNFIQCSLGKIFEDLKSLHLLTVGPLDSH